MVEQSTERRKCNTCISVSNDVEVYRLSVEQDFQKIADAVHRNHEQDAGYTLHQLR